MGVKRLHVTRINSDSCSGNGDLFFGPTRLFGSALFWSKNSIISMSPFIIALNNSGQCSND